MSNPETPKTASDLRVSASVCVVGVLAEALTERLREVDDAGDYLTIERLAQDLASVVAALPNIAIIEVPSVGYKAQGETDAERYSTIANRVESNYNVGGSNSRAAVAELLRRVSESLAARAAGGQA